MDKILMLDVTHKDGSVTASPIIIEDGKNVTDANLRQFAKLLNGEIDTIEELLEKRASGEIEKFNYTVRSIKYSSSSL